MPQCPSKICLSLMIFVTVLFISCLSVSLTTGLFCMFVGFRLSVNLSLVFSPDKYDSVVRHIR